MIHDPPPRVSAVILAGGKSRRMGRDKAFLAFDGAPLIARVIERVRSLCAEVIIVANDADAYAPFGARVVGDVYPGKGSLGGVFSGLQAARAEFVLAVACDMPFLNPALLRYLISLIPQFDVVIPRASSPSGKTPRSARGDPWRGEIGLPRADQPLAKDRDLHPVHAVYSKRCLAPMEARLRADDLRLISFHDAVRVRVVGSDEVDRLDPKHLSFFNVNTPQDLELANQLTNDRTIKLDHV
jgi:molybdopterin-guanine dinucleotide biosynthesis protein A